MEGLCPGCDCLRSFEKVTWTRMWTNVPKTYYERFKFYILLLCYRYVRKNVRKVGIANAISVFCACCCTFVMS